MDARPLAYDIVESDTRIREILDGGAAFEDRDSIPGETALTHSNGFYVDCTAIFIDIRGSSHLRQQHPQRRTLGKLYRAYVSECVAVLNGDARCKQVFIQGDCVSAVFDTPDRAAINEVFPLVAKLNSLINLLNFRLDRAGIATIRCGIGIDHGRALMLKAGFSGSGINDIIWMGDVLNRASHLCHKGAKGGLLPIQVSADVANLIDQERLDVEGKKFLSQSSLEWAMGVTDYQCDVINVVMDRYWRDEIAKVQPPAPPSLGLAALLYPTMNAAPPPPQPLDVLVRGLRAGLPPSPSTIDLGALLVDLQRKRGPFG